MTDPDAWRMRKAEATVVTDAEAVAGAGAEVGASEASAAAEARAVAGAREGVREGARESAMRLLARREHSRLELRRKLTGRGHPPSAVEAALAALAEDGLQSDERFAASYVYTALERGHGEHKIRAALRERGIEPSLAGRVLDLDAEAWQQRAQAAVYKRFGDAPPRTPAEWAKRARFLAGRGFGAAVAAAAAGRRPETQFS